MNHKTAAFFIAQGAIIAAAYVVLTIAFAPFSFKEIQIRVSEALTILPMFTSAAVPGTCCWMPVSQYFRWSGTG